MSKMHELLAVEADAQGQYKTILKETKKDFSDKANLFTGSLRRLEVFDDTDKTDFPEEHLAITTTVQERLVYTSNFVIRYYDVMLQKESTNQLAKADIEADGVTIAKDVPATCLLGLESRLRELREVYANIPTLQSGVEWEKDETIGKGVWKMTHAEEKLRTAKKFQFQVLYKATDKHPAQIEKWEEQVPTGKFIKNVWSGMVSSAEKARLLGNVDTLITAVKKARQRANTQEVVKANIGKALFDFIHRT